MIRSAILLLAAAQLVAGDPHLPGPAVYTYSSQADAALPALPSGFVRTISFSFSPDEQWLAILAGARTEHYSTTHASVDSTLLLIPFRSPARSPVRIDLGMPARIGPRWSPGSNAIAVQGANIAGLGGVGGPVRVYDLCGEEVWSSPDAYGIAGFIDSNRLLARRVNGKKAAGFETIDIRTATVTLSGLNAHWRIAAVNPDRGLIAAFPDQNASRTLIVDYATGQTLRSLKNQVWLTGAYPGGTPSEYFADNGKAICSAALVGKYDTRPECKDVDTGKTIATFERIQGGMPADASTHGSRMVLSGLNYLPGGWGAYTFGGLAVWDFRTGAEVATWKARAFPVAWFSQTNRVVVPSVGISPAGRYIALGLGGELRIYDLH